MLRIQVSGTRQIPDHDFGGDSSIESCNAIVDLPMAARETVLWVPGLAAVFSLARARGGAASHVRALR
jgi:hypothetical protein